MRLRRVFFHLWQTPLSPLFLPSLTPLLREKDFLTLPGESPFMLCAGSESVIDFPVISVALSKFFLFARHFLFTSLTPFPLDA